MTDTEKKKQLRRQAMALPTDPGVYLMKDAAGGIIYIGKAKVLKNRVSQYFGSDARHNDKVRKMVSQVDRFDYIVVGSEFEALVLECSLIKQYQPKYNILLKDDKGYHYIRISPPPFSRITEEKQKKDDGAQYLGPYLSGYTVKQAVDEANRVFGLSTCRRPLTYGKKGERPCLNRHIGLCCGPCSGRIRPEEYAERVAQAVEFLQNGSDTVLTELTEQMEQAAERLDFEKAAQFRDRITAIRRLSEKQRVVQSKVAFQDVIAAVGSGGKLYIEVFRFKGGKLYDREDFCVAEAESLPAARAEFLRRYYSLREEIPPQVTIDGIPEDRELLERWLSEKAGRRVRIVCPQKGEQASLVAMCRDNAAERAAQKTGTTGKNAAALDELAGLLGLSAAPTRLELYDISHTAGSNPVAGMVVFENGAPLKSAYRKFHIRTAQGGDDYASMREVIERRLEEYRRAPNADNGFGTLPDVILLDGGRGHVSAVKPVLEAFDCNVPLFGLVKDSRHRTRAVTDGGDEIHLQNGRAAFRLLSLMQDEVHRFAIGFHRQQRKRHMLMTALTQIDGIGKTRAENLLRAFGSVKAIKEATEEQLCAVKGMTRTAAQKLMAYWQEHPDE